MGNIEKHSVLVSCFDKPKSNGMGTENTEHFGIWADVKVRCGPNLRISLLFLEHLLFYLF